MKTGTIVAISVFSIIVFILILMFGLPVYNVWQQGLAGKAALERAEQERQVLVSKAKAELEASHLQAQAIETVGKMAQLYPEYRYQEFISAFADALHSENSPIKMVFVPTEANVPLIIQGIE